MSKILYFVLPSSSRFSRPKSGRELVSAGNRKTEVRTQLFKSGVTPAMAPKLEGKIQISARQAQILVCLSAALIAAVDLSLRANINVATLYFVVIVLAGWTRSAA